MRYYVFHDDDPYGPGTAGLSEFGSEADALAFVAARAAATTRPGVSEENYAVILGRRVAVAPVPHDRPGRRWRASSLTA